jgi:prevent-host-death family protein
MSVHSVAEAKNRLSSLIDRAMKGEEVVITRHGRPVVALRPLSDEPSPLTDEDIDWLVRHRVGKMPAEDAATLIRRLRDEEDH